MNGWDVGRNCTLRISWNTKYQKVVGVFLGEIRLLLKKLTLLEEKVNSVIIIM